MSGPLPVLAEAVQRLVGVELAVGDGERDELLLGATTTRLSGTAAGDAIDVARLAATAKSLLGNAAYESAYGRGAAMTWEQALAVR